MLTPLRPTTMHEALLELERFGVAFGRRVILACVDLRVEGRGTTTLMGPGGVGKSTLVRTLAGRNASEPSLRTWGSATYGGRPLPLTSPPALVGQQQGLMNGSVLEGIVSALPDRARIRQVEQRARALEILEGLGVPDLAARFDDPVNNLSRGDLRLTSLAAAIASDPALLLIDEPTAGLDENDRLRVLAAIRRRSETHAVLLVTHNRADACALEGHTALLAGGSIVEYATTREFFSSPRTRIAQGFVETGNCAVISPPPLDQLVEDGLVPSSHLKSVERAPSSQSGPWSAFVEPVLAVRWVLSGKLAGVARPGLLSSVDRDLTTLVDARIELLICLEESQVVPNDVLARYGIECFPIPIADMDVPSFADMLVLCTIIEAAVEAGRPVAVHCRAGLGRTGTVLAAYLIWKGQGHAQALSRVRLVEARFVQSERQLDFLAQFEAHLQKQPPAQTSVAHSPLEG